MNTPLQVEWEGRTWRTYSVSYDTPDGVFSTRIMAISMEHAAAMVQDLKDTARLDGEIVASGRPDGLGG